MTNNPFLPTGGTTVSFPQLQRGSLTSVCFYRGIVMSLLVKRLLLLKPLVAVSMIARSFIGPNLPETHKVYIL